MHLKGTSCKLFADDTTLSFCADELDKATADLKLASERLMAWCANNRLDINWSKTFLMVVTNKRVTCPTEIQIGGNPIKVVEHFKLLRVTIDYKLTFNKHISAVCRSINYKLHSIKKLFYLSTTVKIQFLKSFIMPYVDYCLTLSVYYSNTVLQRLSNAYYACLNLLFKFNFTGQSPNDINNFLEKYILYAFPHRVLYRLFNFARKTLSNEPGPPILESYLKRNGEKAMGCTLRNSEKIYVASTRTNKGEATFCYFFATFINEFGADLFKVPDLSFKKHIYSNINIYSARFLAIFEKFNLKYHHRTFRKK